ncbi:hypothetical protein BJX70DRAFT_409460 [Aspergillus crustosus]
MGTDDLLRIYSILHLIFHRNKNQHGGTAWWKWLSILKRTVWNLIKSSNLSHQRNNRSATNSYKRRLADQVIPSCYIEFSVVVADAQFSTLGTVLLATLARLSKSTNIDKALRTQFSIQTSHINMSSPRMEILKEKEDVGEALAREEEAEITNTQHAMAATTSKSNVKKALNTARPRDKKKKKNAIDDLFGLL